MRWKITVVEERMNIILSLESNGTSKRHCEQSISRLGGSFGTARIMGSSSWQMRGTPGTPIKSCSLPGLESLS
jgi:hypothetical protein